ncbi:hypothetical protein B0J12DRAFT_647529 [Macrophomina phaseolina]|uniref:Zn(2)-C6 fungal-type domain-containing protein n=1 Tax=Macrophomina phaseolina TaxID=35725 RepID=A0ABQ8GPD1_9PEZI|nr:hypothetical protein B0J12DRAFT_647529 [Macrophomina phaseolina]
MSPSVREPVVHNGVRLDEKDRIPDTPVSGFTAVNGRSPPHTLKLSGNGSERRHSRAGGSPDTDRPQERRLPSQHRDPPDRPPSPRPLDREPRLASPGKRKRSLSDDDDDDDHEAAALSRRGSRSLPRGSFSPSTSEEEDDEPLDADSRDPSARPRDFSGPPQGHERPSQGGAERDGWGHERTRADGVGPSGQYADVLQREPQSIDPSQRNANQPDGTPSQSNNDYGSTTEFTRAGVQVDVKKRKRVFSNRTKTGCQTCRRRKKKCDEAKPECNNCTRGGFVCEGYLSKMTWPKPGVAKSHVPLQSKHGYADHPGIFPRPPTEPYHEPRPPQSFEGARARPILVEDERPAAQNVWAAWTGHPERVATNDYSRTAPSSEAPASQRAYNDHSMYTHGQSGPSIVSPPVHPPQHLSSSRPAVTAHLALQQSSALQLTPQVPPQGPLTEKEKMLSGDYFVPLSPQLIEERDQCKIALWKFNNAANPANGQSREEQMRLFRAILEAPHARNPGSRFTLSGSIGRDVHIETPFHCDYGYNVVIGDDVVIGPMCRILDSKRVRIGSRSILGPNVSIFSMDYSKNARDRRGTKALASAADVLIEEDVYIGGNVTILPDTEIGQGSIIGAGSVVTRGVSRSARRRCRGAVADSAYSKKFRGSRCG